jgi:hypothetical protein
LSKGEVKSGLVETGRALLRLWQRSVGWVAGYCGRFGGMESSD